MTLREAVNEIGINEEPMECAFLIIGFLRAARTGVVGTFEDDCAGLLVVTGEIGRVDGPDTVKKWLDMLGRIPDMEVPDSVWLQLTEDGE